MTNQSNHYKQFAILYVDDEEKALKYFKRAFRDDFQIITTHSVDLALDILAQQGDNIGVLITDQRMPDKNGTELLKAARRDNPEIVRLLTTAYSDLDTAIEAVNRGEIFRYINKPWELSSLRMDLRNALDFFDLRRERDFLLQEKLSVRYRMKQSERIRDFIIMAGSFAQVRYPLHAIEAFLRQIPFNASETEDSNKIDWASLDLWSHIEQETERMLTIAQSTIQQTQTDGAQPHSFHNHCHLKPLLESIRNDLEANNKQVLRLNIPENTPSLQMNQALLQRMFKAVIGKVATATAAQETIEISVENHHPQNRLTLSIISKPITGIIEDYILFAPTTNTPSLAESCEFLSAFFICYHHGGTLNTATNDPSKINITISLPLDPLAVEVPPLDEYWLEQILARLEG